MSIFVWIEKNILNISFEEEFHLRIKSQYFLQMNILIVLEKLFADLGGYLWTQ